MIRFEDIRFRSVPRVHEKSTFVGYANGTLVVPDALGEDGDLALHVRGIEIKITERGPRFDFKSEKGRDGVWYDLMFPKNGNTRKHITAALLSDPLIAAAIRIAMEQDELPLDYSRSTRVVNGTFVDDEVPF